MREIFANFSLLCAMLVKIALVTGIGPGIAIALAGRKLLGWGERTATGKMMDLPVLGAGARPVNFREVA